MIRIAAAICLLGVALGAFGAHALRATLQAHQMIDVWKTAIIYHLIHGVALLALALWGRANLSVSWLFIAGIILFSGSLYGLAATGAHWLGPITPLGGLCFLVGWTWLIIFPTRQH